MKYKLIFPILSLFCIVNVFSQNEASNWYFGQNAGLHFNGVTGTVTPLTDGQLNTLEGCTSISDPDGNLLFYSDGRTVWNAAHQPMANANELLGTGLKGDDSSTSSGLIVPKPEDPNSYYIFTVDEPHHFNSSAFPNNQDGDGVNDGLMYSLVDMSLNSGLGDVDPFEKNVQLITYDTTDPDEVDFKCSEKITAVKADDCSSFWVITHFTDSFYAFKVDINGVNTTPVVSVVGPEVPVSGYRRNGLGYLKASPDGSKLAAAHHGFATELAGESGGGIYLFDFNNDTGEVSNSQELYSPINNNSPYGLEFSAQNKKLYATISQGIDGAGTSQVVQWNLEANNIPNSQTVIHSSNQMASGALQLGIDKKIYRAQVNFSNISGSGQYLGIIHNPEATGSAANYDETGIFLDINGGFQNISRIGLPPFIQSLFNTEIDIIQNGISTTQLLLCEGDSYTLTAEDVSGATYNWTKDDQPLSESTYQLFVDTPGFYEVYIDPNNGECPIVGDAIVSYHAIPEAHQPENIIACDLSTTSTFDFTTQDATVLDDQNPNNVSVHYFTSIEDAEDNTNEIEFPFNNTVNPQEIFVRVQNSANPNCYDTTSFFVEVYIAPIINALEDITICDEDFDSNPLDGISTINLSNLYTDIYGNQDQSLYNISFHTSQENADSNSSPLPNNFTNSIAFEQEIFVRIENNFIPECYNTESFLLTVNPAPEANETTLLQCDEDGIPEGFTVFNLIEAEETITGGASNRKVEYYISEEEATSEATPIEPNEFHNYHNPQTLYVLVTNLTTGCINTTTLTLEASTTSANNTILENCDDDGIEDGFYTFTLTDASDAVLNALPPDLDLDYYETYEDALLEINPLASSFTNTIPYNQTIYARVEDSNACYGISEIQLSVLKLPNIETQGEAYYCTNLFPETLTLTGGVIDDLPNNYYFNWSTGETTTTIEVDSPGTYTVRVTNTLGCFKDRTITVYPSNNATIESVEVIDASENNIITVFVSGDGDYEYALDNIDGPYQDSPTFTNVQAGLHTVYVRDKNGCGVTEKLVSVIGFPKFFTPNGDGYNDFWQVWGISDQFQPNSTIYIFDRYGKLIKELDPLGPGWDGTLNGKRLPASDYWFSVTLTDGRTFTSHFALKR
ncbi:T9SS type B sorting domain-containing protein [Mangrovimonas sp. YM274]|uniref:T9SS type B sorting domain-containing protein n=1 Tax=Mangrovimonas sp. YM274 TaxID=3070660 RepID=UPI0027DDAEE2|nr:T9SS type B sorting domain-containing protein [Mangrovimonas sp. YM274]WMI67849.1 T9SS type B sorting domain-containing protein [Mangrovimonas sp. YM274]